MGKQRERLGKVEINGMVTYNHAVHPILSPVFIATGPPILYATERDSLLTWVRGEGDGWKTDPLARE